MKHVVKMYLFFLSTFIVSVFVMGERHDGQADIPEAPPTVTARVFIHGTVLAGYFFVDITASWNDQHLEHSLVERAMASARRHPFLHHSEVVLDLGLTDITPEIMVPLAHPLLDPKAAIVIIRAFERTDRCVSVRTGDYRYYTFGWSGALSERKRNKESAYLYESLRMLKNILKMQYPGARIKFELYAHSHGGQLIAHLPIVHKNFPGEDFFIDLAVLCATPLYKEKIQPMVSSSIFGTIINLYSCGDRVQNLDFISTPQHYCVKTFQELCIPLPQGGTQGPRVLDVSLGVHNNRLVFSHESFFCCTMYSLPSYFRKRSAIRKTLNFFAPLPILVLYPTFISSIAELDLAPGFHSIEINFDSHAHNTLVVSTYERMQPLEPSATIRDIRHYRIQPLSVDFLKEYTYRARTSRINHVKYTLHHLMHS